MSARRGQAHLPVHPVSVTTDLRQVQRSNSATGRVSQRTPRACARPVPSPAGETCYPHRTDHRRAAGSYQRRDRNAVRLVEARQRGTDGPLSAGLSEVTDTRLEPALNRAVGRAPLHAAVREREQASRDSDPRPNAAGALRGRQLTHDGRRVPILKRSVGTTGRTASSTLLSAAQSPTRLSVSVLRCRLKLSTTNASRTSGAESERRDDDQGAQVQTTAPRRMEQSASSLPVGRVAAGMDDDQQSDAGPGAIATSDCGSWRGIARAIPFASRRQRWRSTFIRSAAHARPHSAYARDATRPAKWRFRGSSPSEHLVGTALGRPHS
jgi:hypothetical protein